MTEESRIARKRKREICMAAKSVFLEKGFHNTTMEDVIDKVGMSKGGVYYYYKSTVEMLIDLCFIGQEVREQISCDYKTAHPEMTQEDILVELTMMKMFRSNEYMTLYAMLLEVSAYDDQVKDLCEEMERKQMAEFVIWTRSSGIEELIPLTNEEFFMLMKSMYVAQLYFDLEELYMEKSDFFRDIIRNYLRKHKEDPLE